MELKNFIKKKAIVMCFITEDIVKKKVMKTKVFFLIELKNIESILNKIIQKHNSITNNKSIQRSIYS